MVEARYVYSFCVWPSETWRFRAATVNLFHQLSTRLDMVFTEPDFERFRSELNHDGLTLREVERVPYHEPEAVL